MFISSILLSMIHFNLRFGVISNDLIFRQTGNLCRSIRSALKANGKYSSASKARGEFSALDDAPSNRQKITLLVFRPSFSPLSEYFPYHRRVTFLLSSSEEETIYLPRLTGHQVGNSNKQTNKRIRGSVAKLSCISLQLND